MSDTATFYRAAQVDGAVIGAGDTAVHALTIVYADGTISNIGMDNTLLTNLIDLLKRMQAKAMDHELG